MMEGNTHWHSVDAHFEDGAGSISLSLLPIKAVNNQDMTMCNLLPPRLHMIYYQQSLTFRWRLFSWWGMEGIVICFANNGSQKFLYHSTHPIGGVISQDAWPKIVDAPMTLISMMGHGGYCNLCCLKRQPKIPLWLITPFRRSHFPRHMTKNCWHSVDAHFHYGAGRVLLCVLRIKAAKNCFMTEYNLSEVWFPRTHEQKSLNLRWRSFCHGCSHTMQSFILAQSMIHLVLATFLAFSYTFFLITTLSFNNT